MEALYLTWNAVCSLRSRSANILSVYLLNRAYMSAHVLLLNLFNELRKRDKKRGLLSILSPFRNEFNKFNNTRARMLDFNYPMTSKLIKCAFLTLKHQHLVIFYDRTR